MNVRQLRPIVLLALAVATSACGENVDFASGVDSGAPDGGAAADDRDDRPLDATTAARDAALDGAGRGPCLGGFGPDAAGGPCRENGSMCRSTRDCCSGRCEQGYCLPSGACAAPGVACSTRSSCCSGRCEPLGRSGALACTQYCQADGTRCADPSDCCSLGCNGGTCGGSLCETSGAPCAGDSQCCSAQCNGNRCAPAPTSCLATGEGCGDESGVKCCSGFCNARTGRCDLGPGGCRETSSPCNVDGDCCRGQCLRDPQGVDVCTAPCLADGQDCNSNGDCCDGVCAGSPSRCGALSPGCP